MPKLGFVGLGTMGLPMAGHLLSAGNDLTVWSRTLAKADSLKEKGAKVADDLVAMGRDCNVVCLCVPKTEDVQQCLEALTQEAKPNTLFVDHSTILPKGAIEIYDDLKQKGMRFVDAPITGGSMGAQKGQLTVFMGGDEDDIDEAKKAIQPYTKRAERVGGPGAGQMMKMVNQIAVVGALLALCEGLAFAEKAGLDLAQTRELVGSGAAGSWAFENYGPMILNRDWRPGFTIDNQLKDLDYCLSAAEEIGAKIPGAAMVREFLQEMQARGEGGKTTAALFEELLGQ